MNFEFETLDCVFHGCKGVYADEDSGLIFVWRGGATVNIYYYESLAFFDVYTDQTLADYDDFARSVREHVEHMQTVEEEE
jgi:hypothetical protein